MVRTGAGRRAYTLYSRGAIYISIEDRRRTVPVLGDTIMAATAPLPTNWSPPIRPRLLPPAASSATRRPRRVGATQTS